VDSLRLESHAVFAARRPPAIDSGVPTVKVVPSFNEFKDCELGFLVRAETVLAEQLAFPAWR
jgi:hypothetical protein